MTPVLDRSDVFGTRPSDTTVSEEALFALRTRRRRPEQRFAQRLLARLDELTYAVDETLASNAASYEELCGAVFTQSPSRYVTSAGGAGHHVGPEDLSPAPARRALQALNVLVTNLGVTETSAAEVAQISRNTVRGWREGRAPYPATTRRLFQLSNLFEAIERSDVRVAEWIEQASPTGQPRRELLRLSDGPALLARDAAGLLFGTSSVRTLAMDLPNEDEQEMRTEESNVNEPQFTFSAARARRKKR